MNDTGLVFEEPPAAPDHVNILAYGPPKSGKSTAAATAPGPILWVNAEGPGALAYARKTATERGTTILEVRIERDSDPRQILRDVITHVRQAKGPKPQTVVVDTLAKLRDALARQLVNPGAKNSIQQWQDVAKILREFVQIMRDAPVNLVLIAHQDVADAEGDRIVRPLIGGVLTEEVPGEVDVIAYTHSFKDDESGDRRYVGQLVEAKGRIAGDRSGGLGSVRDLDLTEWLEAYKAALTPDTSDLPWDDDAKAEADQPEPEPLALATGDAPPATITPDEAQALWDTMRARKLTRKAIRAALASLGVEGADQLQTAELEGAVGRLSPGQAEALSSWLSEPERDAA